MNAKHSPGPWESEGTVRQIAGYFDGSGIGGANYWHTERIVNGEGETIAHCSRFKSDDGDYLESIANSRLISAAPELLEAARTALLYYKMFRDASPSGPTERDDIASVESAIAKAEGSAGQ